jgi:hypothetical protein
MKLLFTFCAGCLFLFDTYAQSTNPDTLKLSETKSKFSYGEIQGKGSNEITEEKKIEIREKLKLVDSHLQAIEIKRKYILENPDQKEIAEREGWFKDMDRQIEELNERKRALNALLQE